MYNSYSVLLSRLQHIIRRIFTVLLFRRTSSREGTVLDRDLQPTSIPVSEQPLTTAPDPELTTAQKVGRLKSLFRRGKKKAVHPEKKASRLKHPFRRDKKKIRSEELSGKKASRLNDAPKKKNKKKRPSLAPKKKRRLLKRLLRNLVPGFIRKPVRMVARVIGKFFQRFLIMPFVRRMRDPTPEAFDIKPRRLHKHFWIGAWGWIAIVTVSGALGLLLIAVGYGYSRNVGPARLRMYMYPGILLLFVPVAARMVSPSASRTERIVSLCISGLSCYVIKILTSPLHLYLYDEFLHWRSANDIIASGHFFTLNALLPVSPYYPGTEIVTLAFGMMSGLDVFHSALIVVGIARLMMTLTLFAMNEELFQSPRTASIATVFYMINPHYLFFDTQYAYETLALPLALIIFLIVVPYQNISMRITKIYAIKSSVTSHRLFILPSATMLVTKDRSRLKDNLRAIKLTGVITIIALTFTHHATDFFFIALLGFWAVLYRWMHLAPVLRSFSTWLVLIGLVCAVCWINAPNNPVWPYLSGFLSTIFAHSGKHFVSKSVNVYSALPWEKNLAQNGSYFTMAIVPLGLLFLWQRYRSYAFARMLGLISLGLPASYVLRTSDSGIQLADRASAVLFIGVSSVVGVMVTQLWPVRTFRWYHLTFMVVIMTLLFMGGYILSGGSGYGAPPTPYIVGGDSRSIEIVGIQAATWMGTYLGSGNHVGTDHTNQLLLATFGNQRIIESIADHIDLATVFLDPSLSYDDIDLMVRARLRYIETDQRLSTSLPAVGEYIEKGEPGSTTRSVPIPLAYLTKFNTMPGVNKVFDGGSIVIYDVREYIYAHKHH